jgi:hypothetical protein
MTDILFRGQGKVFLGLRDTSGNPKNLRYVGNVPELKFTLESTVLEHKESTSGNNLTDRRIETAVKSSCSMTLESIQKDNLALAFRGNIQTVASGDPITGETLGGGSTTAVVGDILCFAKRNAGTVSIKDSTGSPKTLVADTNYKLHAKAGHIELLDLTTGGPFVQPFKADYTPGACSEVGLFTQGSVNYYLRFVGLNTADTNEPVIVDLYSVLFDPAKDFGLIQDDFAKFQLDGSCLMDSSRSSGSALGQFGAVYNLK